MRNKLAILAADCDCSAAINESKMLYSERKELQELIRKAYQYIDKRIAVCH